jgi:hypothetical protein
VRRWIVLIALAAAAVWGYRQWTDAPPEALPAELWVKAPYRGPAVCAEPAISTRLGASLLPLTPEPPLETLEVVPPDARVLVVPDPRIDRRAAVYVGWRDPLPPADRITPQIAAKWGVRAFRFTGRTEARNGSVWAHYEREDAK